MPGPRTLGLPRWLSAAIAWLLIVSFLMPLSETLAATDLTSGDAAVIADANGDPVRLRSEPSVFGEIIASYPEGTSVTIDDGTFEADDGTLWYAVSVDGQSGYMIADYLSLAGDDSADTASDGDESLNVTPDDVTGTATIVNTNGDPIRCRADASTDSEIITRFMEGDSVDLRGDADGEWQPVVCGGRNGWVHAEFVSSTSAQGDDSSSDGEVEDASTDDSVVLAASISTGSGTIVKTDGDGARCRNKATTGGKSITTIAEGASVSLRGNRAGNWQPVICSNQDGWVWADYVAISGASDGSTVTGQGEITGTSGAGVRCRSKASLDGSIVTVLVEGDEVDLRGAKSGDWQPVFCDSKKGYIFADYVGSIGSSDDDPSSSSGLEAGDSAKVSGTNGDGVRLRSSASASASVITVVGEGQLVDVRSGSTGDWVAVKYNGSSGFIHMDYLVKADAPSTGNGPSDGLTQGDHAMVTDTINFRDAASKNGEVIGLAMSGIVVLITGTSSNGYFPVDWSGTSGWMHGDYLSWTDDQLSPGLDGVGGDAGDGSSTAIGQQMVDYAMNYLGYPYIWATHGPNSFDCSGFTYWVTKHVMGKDIGAGTWTQVTAGTPVSYGNLQPGDLVFFQNTYTWGLSHVGIYIGDNKFIHAENEDTGVRISSLTSTYYSTRYYGAVRLG